MRAAIEYQLLHHRLDAPALGASAHRARSECTVHQSNAASSSPLWIVMRRQVRFTLNVGRGGDVGYDCACHLDAERVRHGCGHCNVDTGGNTSKRCRVGFAVEEPLSASTA
jgi:hypothetical protein